LAAGLFAPAAPFLAAEATGANPDLAALAPVAALVTVWGFLLTVGALAFTPALRAVPTALIALRPARLSATQSADADADLASRSVATLVAVGHVLLLGLFAGARLFVLHDPPS